MNKTCRKCQAAYEVTDEDLAFYEKISPVFGGKKYLIPAPTMCPECRQQRRTSFRNFRSLHHRKCDVTKQDIISMYSGHVNFPVYSNEYWWSDNWDAKSYGQGFDFSRSFFEQLLNLDELVPRHSTANTSCENSVFSNMAFQSKNCYLVFGCVHNEDCLYGKIIWQSNSCMDGLYLYRCEFCYDSLDLVGCNNVHFSAESANCSDSYFLYNCRDSKNCFASRNLRNQEYVFKNKQYSKEEYLEKTHKELPLNYSKILKYKVWLTDSIEKSIFPEIFGINNENVRGNHIYESKNTYQGFDIKKAEDSKYLYTTNETSHSYDISFTGVKIEFCLEGLTIFNVNNCIFSHYISSSNDVYYSQFCFNSNNLFGCNGLRNAEYCILNKQYSKEEYEELVPRIIEHMKQNGEWGEFFPSWMSPFGYNETVANDYFPLTREEVLHDRRPERSEGSLEDSSVATLLQNDDASSENNSKLKQGQWFNWSDYIPPSPEAKKTIPAEKLPDDIKDIPDDILNWAIICEVSKKPFKIIKQELDFYRRMNIPVPRKHPDVRHKERMKLRNPRKLWKRQCQKCSKDIETTYAPERPEIVYCEECYLQEVY